VTVNIFWTILNLLPILPLDGGHLVRIIFEGIFGLRGLKFAMLLSVILAAFVGSYFFFVQQVFMGALFFMLGFESYRNWQEMKNVSTEDSDTNLRELLQSGVEQLKNGFSDQALETFRSIRQKAPKGMLYVAATQYGARVLSEQGNYKKAYDWLLPLKNRLSQEYVHVLQQLAYRLQNWEEAASIGLQSYQQEPTADTAFLNALCYAIMGKEKPAVGWLHNAVQLGLPNVEEALKRREFDAIRDTEGFKHILENAP
jgi:stage IV sporulation protein FB